MKRKIPLLSMSWTSRMNYSITTMELMPSDMKSIESRNLSFNLKTPMSSELTSALSIKGLFSYSKL